MTDDARFWDAEVIRAYAVFGIDPLDGVDEFGFPRLSVDFLRRKAERQLRDAFGRWREMRGVLDMHPGDHRGTPGRGNGGFDRAHLSPVALSDAPGTAVPLGRRVTSFDGPPLGADRTRVVAEEEIRALLKNIGILDQTLVNSMINNGRFLTRDGVGFFYVQNGYRNDPEYVGAAAFLLEKKIELERIEKKLREDPWNKDVLYDQKYRIIAGMKRANERLEDIKKKYPDPVEEDMQDAEHILDSMDKVNPNLPIGLTVKRSLYTESGKKDLMYLIRGITKEEVGTQEEFQVASMPAKAFTKKTGSKEIFLFIDRIKSANRMDGTQRMPWEEENSDFLTFVVAHELGHALADPYVQSVMHISAASDLFYDARNSEIMSTYGKTHMNEAYSEIFAQWVLQDSKLPINERNPLIQKYAERFGWDQQTLENYEKHREKIKKILEGATFI